MTVRTPSTEQIRQSWDAIARRFDDLAAPLAMSFGQEIVDRLDVRPGTRFLDVGTGSGALAIPAARRGADVLAVDLAPAMIERLRARARRLPNLRGRVMDGEHLDLPDDAFDLAASLNGVTLFPGVGGGIAELARVTKRGGRVVLSCFAYGIEHAEWLAFLFAAVRTAAPEAVLPPADPAPLPFQLSDPQQMRAGLIRAGLTDVSVGVVSWDVRVRSATHYLDAVTASHPIATRVVAPLTARQQADVRQVLDGMLRERSDGSPGAVLHTPMNIAVGSKC